MGGPSLGSKRLPGKQTQTEKGVNNANARRSRAFRAGLVRAVALLHDRHLQQLRDGAAGNTADGGHTKAKVCQAQQPLSLVMICHVLQIVGKVKAPWNLLGGRLQPLPKLSVQIATDLFNAQSWVEQLASPSQLGKASTCGLKRCHLITLILLSRGQKSRRHQRGERRPSRAGSGIF